MPQATAPALSRQVQAQPLLPSGPARPALQPQCSGAQRMGPQTPRGSSGISLPAPREGRVAEAPQFSAVADPREGGKPRTPNVEFCLHFTRVLEAGRWGQ